MDCCLNELFIDVLVRVVVVTSPPGRVRSIVMSVSVRMFSCVTRKPHGRTTPAFVHAVCEVWPWLGSLLTALCTSGFVDNVIFLHNGLVARHVYY